MAANLIVSLTQKEVKKPYKFKTTNINVYSFEEALYHCYHYWKQSVDDFLCDEFIDWVNDTLGLSLVASKLKKIAYMSDFSQRLLSFLHISDYLSGQDFTLIKMELEAWEKRLEWEKLKERGDYLMNNNEPSKAFVLYKKALDYCENTALMNNAGIALMKQGKFDVAAEYFIQALKMQPDDMGLVLNCIEAHILNKEYGKADRLIGLAEAFGEISELHYFRGEISFYKGNYFSSVPYYEKAISLKEDPMYIYRLSDVFVKLRQYDKALETLAAVKVKDKLFLKKQADIYVIYNNIPAAIKCMEKGLVMDRKSVELWVRLAEYHRLDYDLLRANNAIIAALALSPESQKVRLEHARIKKSQGKTKEYQTILNGLLKDIKHDYRENSQCK